MAKRKSTPVKEDSTEYHRTILYLATVFPRAQTQAGRFTAGLKPELDALRRTVLKCKQEVDGGWTLDETDGPSTEGGEKAGCTTDVKTFEKLTASLGKHSHEEATNMMQDIKRFLALPPSHVGTHIKNCKPPSQTPATAPYETKPKHQKLSHSAPTEKTPPPYATQRRLDYHDDKESKRGLPPKVPTPTVPTPSKTVQASRRTLYPLPPPERERTPVGRSDSLPNDTQLSQSSTNSSEAASQRSVMVGSLPRTPATPVTPALPPSPPEILNERHFQVICDQVASVCDQVASVAGEMKVFRAEFRHSIRSVNTHHQGGVVDLERASLEEPVDAIQQGFVAHQQHMTDYFDQINNMSASLETMADKNRTCSLEAIKCLSRLSEAIRRVEKNAAATRLEVLARADQLVDELKASQSATATTILAARNTFPSAMVFTEHKIETMTDAKEKGEPSAWSLEALMRGEVGGWGYLVNERTGEPMINDKRKIYPFRVEANSELAMLLLAITKRCEIGFKYVKAGAKVVEMGKKVGVLASSAFPLIPSVLSAIEVGFEALKLATASTKGVALGEKDLNAPLRSLLLKVDPDGWYHGLMQHYREDGALFWAPKAYDAPPTTNVPVPATTAATITSSVAASTAPSTGHNALRTDVASDAQDAATNVADA